MLRGTEGVSCACECVFVKVNVCTCVLRSILSCVNGRLFVYDAESAWEEVCASMCGTTKRDESIILSNE